MADDITLTVRVRDMSQGQLARLRGEINRLQRDMHAAGQSTRSTGQNFQRLTTDVNNLTNRLSRMTANGQMTRRELTRMQNDALLAARGLRQLHRAGDITRTQFRQMSRDIDVLSARLRLLGRDGNGLQRISDRLLVLQDHFRRTDSHAGRLRRSLGAMGDWGTGGLRRGILLLNGFLGGMRRLGSMIPLTKRWIAIIIATILLLGPVAQLIGGLLVAALGGAFIALGALALKGSTSVKKAFSDMKGSVANTMRDAAKPMEGFLVNGMGQVTKSVQQMGPAFKAAFAATGPLIENFFGAFTDLASKAMPNIVMSLKSMGPAIDGFRQGMGLIGQGIGDMFDAMTKNGGAEALGQVWVTLGEEMRHLLTNIGEFINFSAKSSTATMILVGVFRLLSGVLHLVEAGLSALDSVFGSMFKSFFDGALNIDKLKTGMGGMGDSFTSAGKDASTLKTELDNVNNALKDNKKQREAINNMDIPKSMKDRLLDANTESTNTLLSQRESITQQIAAADANAAASAYNHAAAVKALMQSIVDLNNKALTSLDAQAAMEKSIDDAVKNAGKIKGKVKMSDSGILNMDNEAGQKAQELLSSLAKTTTEYAKALTDANAPQEAINAAWERGRGQMIGLADDLGVSKAAMTAYANQVLATPKSVTTSLKVEKEQADAAVASTIAKIGKVPKERKSQIVLEAQRAMERASMVESKLNALNGKVATSTILINTFETTTIRTIQQYQKQYLTGGRSQHDITGATGGLFTGSTFTKRGFANGGRISGPGSGTSDDIFAPWLSDGEFVINARQTQKFLPLIEAINSDQMKLGPGFASGGKVATAAKGARSDLAKQMTISAYGKMTGAKSTGFENSLAKPESLKALFSSVASIVALIKKAFSGKTESALLSRMKSVSSALYKHEKSLTKVNASLAKAKDKLDDLKQAAASVNNTVKTGMVSAADVTKVATGSDKNVTMPDIMSLMQQNAAKAKKFSDMLATLKQKGLSGQMIGQIAEAGMDGGGFQTAMALTTASSAQIKSINSMQQQIDDAAKAAGKTAADSMYGAGIKAAQGLVDGLTKQKKNIEAAMMSLAKSMEKAIKKALGIKSPSRVMMEVGDYTAQGFAVGIQKNRNVDTAWASMLNVNHTKPGGASSPGGGNGEVVIPIYFGNKMLDEIILDSNRRTVRTRGGNAQAVFGKR